MWHDDSEHDPFGYDGPDGYEDKSNVIILEEHRPKWLSGFFSCPSCYFYWTGVCHEDRQTELECPNCGEMVGQLEEVHDV